MSSSQSPSAREFDDMFARMREHREGSAEYLALRQQIIDGSTGLVYSIARKFAHRGEPLDDLVQVGFVGLLSAIGRFDSSRGVSFASYASPTIAGEIQHYFRDNTWVTKVSRTDKDIVASYYTAADRFYAEHGVMPTLAQMADVLGITKERLAAALDAAGGRQTDSLSDLVEVGFDAVAPEGPDQDDAIMVRQLLDGLPSRDRAVMIARFFEDKTQSEIAKQFGCSQMQVSRIISRSLEAMHAGLAPTL